MLGGVHERHIFYSSSRATGIPAGEGVRPYLQRSLQQAGLVIELVSETFLSRPMCLMELGGAWALGTSTYPIVVPPLTRDLVVQRIGDAQMGILDAESDIDDLFDELHDRLMKDVGIQAATTPWNRAIRDFKQQLPSKLAVAQAAAEIQSQPVAWRQYRRSPLSEALTVSDKLSIYLSRRVTVNAFADMLDRAPGGTLIFGQCKSCVDYPESFYQAILRASARGVHFHFIVSPAQDGREFAAQVAGIQTMKIRFLAIEYARILGVENREVIRVISAPAGYVGIHMKDSAAASHELIVFESEWRRSSPDHTASHD